MLDFNPVDLIIAKRDGYALAPDDLRSLVEAYTQGSVPDYQMSAFLMAAYLRGLNERETLALTEQMLYSGIVLDLSHLPGIKVDKHSTGGVGDKVSLLLAPIVAACGVPVPMISGRGLSHTGGTLDKLEAIPGFRTDLSIDAYRHQLETLGVVMIGQTDEIAPADRMLYALRDVTGTVEFIPFIAASIMSKKLAAGIDALVLDVKCGRGAFMKTEEEARKLAETLVGLGEKFGKKTVAWITDMDAPLGYCIGNWPETAEAIRCLKGARVSDLMKVTYVLAGEMLSLGGVAESTIDGIRRAKEAVTSGKAFERFVQLVEAQGGDPTFLDNPEQREGAPPVDLVRAPDEAHGYVADLDPLQLGRVAAAMGAGRLRKGDAVDPTAGITLNKKPGDTVEAGEVLAWLHTRMTDDLPFFQQAVVQAFTYSDTPPVPALLLHDRYADGQWANQ